VTCYLSKPCLPNLFFRNLNLQDDDYQKFDFFSRTTLLLPTARGGFLLVNYGFTKEICCTFTYNSLRNFANDFKKCFHGYHLLSQNNGKKTQPTTLTLSAALYSSIFTHDNLSIIDKITFLVETCIFINIHKRQSLKLYVFETSS
jgi:hypothetical protein